jgi:hypothetical protein
MIWRNPIPPSFISVCQTAWHCIREDHNLNAQCPQNFKSQACTELFMGYSLVCRSQVTTPSQFPMFRGRTLDHTNVLQPTLWVA